MIYSHSCKIMQYFVLRSHADRLLTADSCMMCLLVAADNSNASERFLPAVVILLLGRHRVKTAISRGCSQSNVVMRHSRRAATYLGL